MNVVALGEIGIVGGIAQGAASVVDGVLVVVVTSGGERADAVGLDCGEAHLAVRWSRPLTSGPLHVSAQGWPFLPVASVVADDEGRAFLASGSTRMLVDPHSGEMLRQTSAATSPSASATLHDGLLLVPESRVLAAYDGRTLDLEWRRPAPGRMWIGGAALNGLCPVGLFDQPEAEDAALPPMGLWDLATGRVWPIPAACGTVRAGSLGVAASQVGSAYEVTAFRADSGEIAWRAQLPADLAGLGEPSPEVTCALVVHRETVVLATPAGAVEARALDTGETLWRTDTPNHPVTLALVDGILWVGTLRHTVLALDPDDGRVVDEASLDGRGSWLVLLPTGGGVWGPNSVLALTLLGSVFGLSRTA